MRTKWFWVMVAVNVTLLAAVLIGVPQQNRLQDADIVRLEMRIDRLESDLRVERALRESRVDELERALQGSTFALH
jgi:hypothetical protein